MRQQDMVCIGAASDPLVAREMIRELNPDVITLDVEMPRMDGLEFLSRLMRLRPMPVVMVSTLTEQGADVTLARAGDGRRGLCGQTPHWREQRPARTRGRHRRQDPGRCLRPGATAGRGTVSGRGGQQPSHAAGQRPAPRPDPLPRLSTEKSSALAPRPAARKRFARC